MRWSVELYFSQPDFVFVTGSLICISHELALYFSPKFFISQRGTILEPAAGFAFSKGQNPSELNFQSHEHIVQPWKSFAAVLGPIRCLKMAPEGLSGASKRMNILPTRTSFLAVSWGILLKMTITINTIITDIINLIY